MQKDPGDLSDYQRKRDFSRTPEPRGDGEEAGAGIFVIHKHASRTLHYDFRLELHGTLKSWAVPKGPSVNPADKRLAVHVEDHPIEYAGFEGVIPRGEYGGGSVLLWDRGFWIPEEDPDDGMRKGSLKFILSGRKLGGRWALVRLKDRGDRYDEGEGKEEWLLIKERDGAASEERDIISEMPRSIASNRTIDEIAELPEGIWSATGEAAPVLPSGAIAEKKKMPGAIRPQLAAPVDAPPQGDGWLHEIKYDGYRIAAAIRDANVRLLTRNGNDWTSKFPSIASALSKLPIKEAWLDGEIVSIKEDGTTSFEGLQGALSAGTDEGLVYMIFDIIYYNGYSLEAAPLSDRKLLAAAILSSEKVDRGMLRFSQHVEGRGAEFFDNACEWDVEGIISKKKDSPYFQGRTRSWVKVKCLDRQEFVIGGYTEPTGARAGFGALLIGVFDGDGRFIYSGRVGTGFNERTTMDIWERLKAMEKPQPDFHNPPVGAEAKGVRWVRPELVAEVAFTQWTKDGVLRHPSFQGLREDKPAREVVHENPLKLIEAIGPADEAIAPSEPIAETGPVRMIRKVRVTNPERVFYPDEGYTKADLMDYYETAAPLMLPHLVGRPLTLVRCPEGYDRECFFQKHEMQGMPEEIKRIELTENDGTKAIYLTADTPEAVIGLVQLGVLEIHTWGSRNIKLEYPDRMTFDIDPDTAVEWERLVESVYLIRELLNELGLQSFANATGGKGLHVVVPLQPVRDWEEVKSFSKALAEFIARGLPGRFTSMMTKSRRVGKTFVDYMRNLRGATAIEVYSTRARKGAPIAVPLRWEELMQVRSDSFTLRNIKDRIKEAGNPWEGYMDLRQPITDRMKERLGII